jgi:dTDP-4-dehydrorhamnose reductase
MTVFVIFGSTGMVGSYFMKYLTHYVQNSVVIGVNRSDIDLSTCTVAALERIIKNKIQELKIVKTTNTSTNTNDKAVVSSSTSSSTTITTSTTSTNTTNTDSHPFNKIIIINCAGIIRERIIHQSNTVSALSLATCMHVNALFPHYLQQICDKLGYRLIHISTVCVFQGKKMSDHNNDNNPYYETDLPDERNDIYSVSKRMAEQLLENSSALILRTSLIGHERFNRLSLLEWTISHQNKTVSGFYNHWWNGMTCLQIVQTVSDILEAETMNDSNNSNNSNNSGTVQWSGIKHLFSPQAISKCNLLGLINGTYQLNMKIIPVAHPTDSDKRLGSTCLLDEKKENEKEKENDKENVRQTIEALSHKHILQKIPPLDQQLKSLLKCQQQC